MERNYDTYLNVLKGDGAGSNSYTRDDWGRGYIAPSNSAVESGKLREKRKYMQSLENAHRPSSVLASIRKGNRPKIG